MNASFPLHRHRARPRALLAALAALIALALAGCGSHAADDHAMPPAEVSVAEVAVREVTRWDEFTGRVAAPETVELRPRVSGYIQSVNYREGQEVAAGEVLFEIDPRPYRAELARAEAELRRARSRRDLAHSEAQRAGRLAESGAISREEAEQRNAAAAQAGADVMVARAALDVARLDLEYTRVRSPISGLAGRAMVTTGNLARSDESLLTTIVSLDPVHVYFEGDERSFLRYGDLSRSGELDSARNTPHPVRVGLNGETGFPHRGQMDFLDNRVDPATGTITGRALVANPDRVFTPGLFARVQIPGSGRFEAVLLDDKAVLTDQDRKYVYVLGEDGLAERRDIVPGELIDGLRVVRSGLQAGDRVVVNGTQKIFFPGMPLQAQVVPMDGAAQAPVAGASLDAGSGSAQ
jgi:membrane fusion protein, multidrug efflux system